MITQISWIKPPDLSNLNHNNRNSIKSPAGHTHTINFFDLALPTVLLTRLPQCKPGSLAHSNYKLNPAAVTHHCLAELASRIAEWPGDSNHPAQIIRRTTSMCSPTYLIAAAMIPWSSLSMPAYLAMISSRSIPSNFMTSKFQSLNPHFNSWFGCSPNREICVWRPQLFAHPISWFRSVPSLQEVVRRHGRVWQEPS